jgi:hypothetical protein
MAVKYEYCANCGEVIKLSGSKGEKLFLFKEEPQRLLCPQCWNYFLKFYDNEVPEIVEALEAEKKIRPVKVYAKGVKYIENYITWKNANSGIATDIENTPKRPVLIPELELKHMTGLTAPEYSVCKIGVDAEKLMIVANGTQFNLQLSKLTNASVVTNTEIQNQYVSSVGGMVGGALLFGPVGAMIGGRAKQKQSSTTEHYLVFSYENNGEYKYISFYVDVFLRKAKAFAQKLNEKIQKNNKVVEL